DDSGVQVFFDVTATDAVDGSTLVSCDYSSGYKFPPGVTTMTCTTSDSKGNQATKKVQITVTVTQSGQ
ncbi:MAG: HYR domain-containing protein, partial [Nitrosopumilaceae archaeon]|nr:HYR domain-containing protein [Nitrosopumilaceae archaeon]